VSASLSISSSSVGQGLKIKCEETLNSVRQCGDEQERGNSVAIGHLVHIAGGGEKETAQALPLAHDCSCSEE